MISEIKTSAGAGDIAPGFARMTPSASAERSFKQELQRLRSLSVEERVAEALTMKNRFAWLNPALREKET